MMLSTGVRTLLFLLFVLGCDRSDRAGPAVPLAAARVVTLSPSATEIVAVLGAAGRLVGVDDYSDYPETVKALPKVGSYLSPNLETIVSLKPTLVVVDDVHGQTAGALRDA